MQPNEKALYVIVKSPFTVAEPGKQLALHVQIWAGNYGYPETLCFDDTGRGHMIPGKVIGRGDHAFRFQDKNDAIWEFQEVTIEEFRSRLARFVANGEGIARTIHTTEDLWEFYRKAFPL